jgi:hypothetical protein
VQPASVYCETRNNFSLGTCSTQFAPERLPMAQTVIRRPIIEEDLVPYEFSTCEIYDTKSGNGTIYFRIKVKVTL